MWDLNDTFFSLFDVTLEMGPSTNRTSYAIAVWRITKELTVKPVSLDALRPLVVSV